ncbi:MAG: thioredoxin [Gaiellales bacterium]|nr:MAG: thioredoxin [Gaiellales bacterium]
MSSDDPFEVSESDFDSEVLKSELPVVVDFWAEWCAPCRMVAPLMEEIARDFAGQVRVAKVNVDDNRDIATRFSIMSIPTVMLFRGGEPVKQVVGALPKDMLLRELGLTRGQD